MPGLIFLIYFQKLLNILYAIPNVQSQSHSLFSKFQWFQSVERLQKKNRSDKVCLCVEMHNGEIHTQLSLCMLVRSTVPPFRYQSIYHQHIQILFQSHLHIICTRAKWREPTHNRLSFAPVCVKWLKTNDVQRSK